MRKWFITVPESTLDDRFNSLRQEVDREISRARSEVIAELAAAVSRMRAASNEAEWRDAVLDCGRVFAGEPAALELIASLATLTALTAPAAADSAVHEGSNGVCAAPAAEAINDINPAAQRFARVRIAEIQLYHASAVKAGRDARDLFGALRPHIEAARDAFRDRFLTNGTAAATPTADYLHAEIVHALAHDDATLLGPNYPGPLA